MSLQSPFQNKIKIYSDGADRASMLEMYKNPLIKGLTTNPSLMKKAGITDYHGFAVEILKEIKDKPISFEVFSDDIAEMHTQALKIKTWGENVYVKIPVINSKGQPTYSLIRDLTKQGVKLNITAIFTYDQVYETVLALKGGAPSLVSVFAGRIADSGRDPLPLMSASAELCRLTDKNIELLWASTREVFNIVQAELCGCHVITVPPDIIKKVSGFNKQPLDLSIETVQTFKKDSEAAGFKI